MRPRSRNKRADGFHQDEELPFVVGRAARVNISVANRRLERRRDPFIQRIGRLNVVMAVEQQSGFAGRLQPIGVHQRMARSLRSIRAFFNTGACQPVAHEFGGAAHIARVLGQRADAGNPQEGDQVIHLMNSFAVQ